MAKKKSTFKSKARPKRAALPIETTRRTVYGTMGRGGKRSVYDARGVEQQTGATTRRRKLTLRQAWQIVRSVHPGLYRRDEVRLTNRPSPVPFGTVVKRYDSTGYHDWEVMVVSDFMIDVDGDLQVIGQDGWGFELLDPDDVENARIVSPGYWDPDIVRVGDLHGISPSDVKPDIDDVVSHIKVSLPPGYSTFFEHAEGPSALIRVYPHLGAAVSVTTKPDGYTVFVADPIYRSAVADAVELYGAWVELVV